VLKFAGELKHFIERNGIDPRRVKLVIRCDDVETESRFDEAVYRELRFGMTRDSAVTRSTGRRVVIDGLAFVITNIDATKVD
jgi:hypothetical protein